MNEIMKFEDKNVDILIENDEPLFEVYSTGMALGQVKKNAVGNSYPRKERIDENLVNAEIQPCVRNGHKYITESQLYDLMLEMKTDKVRPFRKWVTNVVLPSIRKTGGYVDNDELFIRTYLPHVDEGTKQLFRTNLLAIRQLNQKIEQDKPLVDFANHVSDTSDLIDIQALSKIAKKENIDIGRNKLFEWLRDNKYLITSGEHKNEPYQQYINQGLFVVRELTYETPYGKQIGMKTYVTGKGQIHLIEKLRREFSA